MVTAGRNGLLKNRSMKLLVLLSLLGVLAMGPGMCKTLEMPKQEPAASPEMEFATRETAVETASAAENPGPEIVDPSENPDLRRFAMVYQSLVEGETIPCG